MKKCAHPRGQTHLTLTFNQITNYEKKKPPVVRGLIIYMEKVIVKKPPYPRGPEGKINN
jgi:hypothetical protein